MLAQIEQLLAASVFEEEEQTRVAGLLNTILLSALVLAVLFVIAAPFVSPNPLFSIVATGALILPLLGALFLARRGHVRLTSILISGALWAIITVAAVLAGGVQSSSFSTSILVILIAGLLLGTRAGVLFAGLSTVAGLGMVLAKRYGLLPEPSIASSPVATWVALTANFMAAAALLHLTIRSLHDALERAWRNERALAERNRELDAVRASLEERVAGRTRELGEMVEAQQQLLKTQERLLDTIRRMSTPVVPVMAGVIVLPLVGSIDSQRAGEVVEALLAGIEAHRARVALVDITGVPVVDTAVAQLILQAATAARLLGTQVVLVGIRPEVAQTVVGLGIDLSELVTRADLQSGVEYAQRVAAPGPPSRK